MSLLNRCKQLIAEAELIQDKCKLYDKKGACAGRIILDTSGNPCIDFAPGYTSNHIITVETLRKWVEQAETLHND